MAKQKHPHKWWHLPAKKSTKTFPWPICIYCGLVKLRNDETEKLIRLGCQGSREEDT